MGAEPVGARRVVPMRPLNMKTQTSSHLLHRPLTSAFMFMYHLASLAIQRIHGRLMIWHPHRWVRHIFAY